MPPKNTSRPNLRERVGTGDYELVDPLDYLILELLPDEGELVMNFYPLAATAPELIKKRFTTFSPGAMAAAITRTRLQGLAVRVRTHGTKSHGYQRTVEGKKVYEAWRKKNPQAPDIVREQKGGKKP